MARVQRSVARSCPPASAGLLCRTCAAPCAPLGLALRPPSLSGRAVPLSGRALLLSSRAFLWSGRAFLLSGRAFPLSGRAFLLSRDHGSASQNRLRSGSYVVWSRRD